METRVKNRLAEIRKSRGVGASDLARRVLQKAPEFLASEMLSSGPAVKSQPVRVCQIGSRWVGVPVSASPYYMPEAVQAGHDTSQTGTLAA